jgi:hypothetical protein
MLCAIDPRVPAQLAAFFGGKEGPWRLRLPRRLTSDTEKSNQFP